MATQSPLGAYLRARRSLTSPGDVGITVGGQVRRVIGLRREEVAILAGISTEYYLRLEQGRETRPSDQVIDALARALLLGEAAREYLHELARPTKAVDEVRHDDVDDGVRWLIESWPRTAAVVHNRYLDVLAANALAGALNPSYRIGVNNLVSLLTDHDERALHEGWEGLCGRTAALVRSMFGQRPDDARLADLVAELSARNAYFRDAWQRNDVTSSSTGVHVLGHPRVGRLVLHYARLPLPGTDGHSIWLYHAEPGTPSVTALERLGRTAPS
ncbi:helix-turn-helix transcriptional regulator [Curtobacterium sp. MCPF17_002]|uniref:helix-turn-helix transcriptional regulator n=1 Tax=Curtobacterium sp. MCPF17_002 TaxID=2175645 RepID=UPI000DA94E0C|nr:helix-turn-helix transcriptional regulator [Curtobacterium sp. MCPF17_002]WIB78281.1 helix-turn-helix transcriptional regulator [Curtobacterium sp. MCPF17_002]